MRILLDTHAFLWWNEDSSNLSRKARKLISDPSNELVLSVASAWEIILKSQSGKLRLPEDSAVYFRTRASHYGMEILPIQLAHALALESLPSHHRDPFDRMLVAQSLVEKLPILTADPVIGAYHASVIW